MKTLSILAAAAVAVIAMPVAASAAEHHGHHHGWHKICKWEGHGKWRHRACRRARW